MTTTTRTTYTNNLHLHRVKYLITAHAFFKTYYRLPPPRHTHTHTHIHMYTHTHTHTHTHTSSSVNVPIPTPSKENYIFC